MTYLLPVRVAPLLWGLLAACGYDGTISAPDATGATSGDSAVAAQGALEGRVCSPSAQSWVASADVRVRGTKLVATTDALGKYRFDPLPAGEVHLDVTKGSFSVSFKAEVVAGQTTLVDPTCLRGDVAIAVVAGLYDNIESVLADLGLQYTLVEGPDTAAWLRDSTNLDAYDIVFFNCGMRHDWQGHPEVAENLRKYVRAGGSVYSSDLAYPIIEASFPDAIEFLGDDAKPSEVQRGIEGSYEAAVVDAGLQTVLESTTADIHYNLRNWTIAVGSLKGESLLFSNVMATPAGDPDGPEVEVHSVLATRVRIGAGTVVFTSFHNEAQITADMQRILEDIILSL